MSKEDDTASTNRVDVIGTGLKRWGRGRGALSPAAKFVAAALLPSPQTRMVNARYRGSRPFQSPLRQLGYFQPGDSRGPRGRRVSGRRHPHFSPHLLTTNNDN